MGTRTPRTENETREELLFIQRTSSTSRYDYFRESVECFREYVEMQATFADRDGFPGMAAAMRHAVEIAK